MLMLLMGLTAFVPLFLGVPIAVSLGGAGLIWIVLFDPNYLRGVAYSLWNTSSSDVLTSVPLFIFMGELIQRTDLARRFYEAIAIWLRRLPGGLLHANIGASAMFAAVCGSSVATAATIGTAAIPNLRRLKYDSKLTLGSLAAGGTLGILIPPSVPLIIYGAIVEASIGQLFVAAVVPGFLLAGLFSAYIIGIVLWRKDLAPQTSGAGATFREYMISLAEMAPLILIMLIILVGIYFGLTTTTEAAALGVLVAVIISLAQRVLTPAILWASLVAVVRFTAMLLFVIMGAQIFSFAVFTWGFGTQIAEQVGGLPYPPIVVLSIIIVIYLILGMFIDSISMMVMTLSLVHPVIIKLGYDPVWFGVVLVILLEIGLITPPVGMNLFTIQAIDPKSISLGDVARGSLPFVGIMMLCICILIAFPALVLWLPSQMY